MRKQRKHLHDRKQCREHSRRIGAITFFLRRTITELDKCREDIAKVKEDYITKEDFFREQADTRRKLDRIMDILLEIRGGK